MTVNSNENTIELWSGWFRGDNRSNDIILDILRMEKILKSTEFTVYSRTNI